MAPEEAERGLAEAGSVTGGPPSASVSQDDGPWCSIVVPCYGSEETVRPLLEEIHRVMGGLERTYEVIFVNDDSPDGVAPVLDELQAAHPDRVGVVHLMHNAGQHAALMAGLRRARGEVVVTMDDDLQHRPQEIPQLLEALTPDVDVVFGAPDTRRHAGWRNLGSAFVRALTVVTIGKPRGLILSSFRVLRGEVVTALAQSQSPFLFLDAEIFRVTRRAVHVVVPHHERVAGRSGYTLGRLVRLTTHLVFNHSALPLRLISILGVVAATFALALGTFVIARRLLGIHQQLGWPSLAILITFFGGATLFSLGMIGEYLIRIVHQTAQRPQFHVRRQSLAVPRLQEATRQRNDLAGEAPRQSEGLTERASRRPHDLPDGAAASARPLPRADVPKAPRLPPSSPRGGPPPIPGRSKPRT